MAKLSEPISSASEVKVLQHLAVSFVSHSACVSGSLGKEILAIRSREKGTRHACSIMCVSTCVSYDFILQQTFSGDISTCLMHWRIADCPRFDPGPVTTLCCCTVCAYIAVQPGYTVTPLIS